MRYSLRSTCLLLAAIFIAAAASAQVQSLDPNYTVSLLASGVQVPDGGMVYRPSTNDFLVTEEDQGQILSVNASTGAVTVFASVQSSGCTNGHCLYDLGVNSSGEVFASGFMPNGPIFHFDSAGNLLGTLTCPSVCPQAIAIDSKDNLYVPGNVPGSSSTAGTTIYEYAAGTTTSPTVFASGFGSIETIRFNAAGQLFATDRPAGTVYQVTPGGTTSEAHMIWASGLNDPDGLAIDPVTNSVFAGPEDGTVSRATSPGVFSTFATGLSTVDTMGFDTAGNLYVADKFTGVIWKFARNVATSTPTITPNHGGNAGAVTVRILGTGLESGATVTLTGSGSSITGTHSTLLNPGILGTTFDLTNAVPGIYNLMVENPDGTSSAISGGFTIDEGGSPQLSVNVVGPSKIRADGTGTFYILYSNTGNVDWSGLAYFALKVTNGMGPVVVTYGSQMVGEYNPVSLSSLPYVTANPQNEALVSTFVLPPLAAGTQSIPYTIQIPASLTPAIQLASSTTMANGAFNIYVTPHVIPPTLFPPDVALPVAQEPAIYLDNILGSKGDELGLDPPSLTDILIDALKDTATDAIQKFLVNLSVEAAADKNLPTWIKDTYKDIGTTLVGSGAAGASPLADYWNSIFNAESGEFLDSALYANYQAVKPPCPDCDPPEQDLQSEIVSSLDPNEIAGPTGIGVQQFVSSRNPDSYTIYFGNATGATASAVNVTVNSQLDISKFNTKTFSFGPVTFGSQFLSPPQFATTYSTVVDLRPTTDLLVAVAANLDQSTGVITWTFRSLDPSTGKPPTDPTLGFLPPNGDASVIFTVSPIPTLATSTEIQGQAAIVFDTNAPLSTQVWLNTIDNTAPVSQVSALSTTEFISNFLVKWSGTDVGAGIQDYTIYVSDNGAPFTAWLTNTTATSATYSGQNGHTYAFYSIARDLVDNIEPSKTTAEATTAVNLDTTPPVITPAISGTQGQNGWYIGGVTVSWLVTDPESGVVSSNGCSATALAGNTAGTKLTCSATNGAGLSSSNSVLIKIDQTPPVLSGLPKPECNLWPPDHRLVHVATVSAKDALSGLAGFNVSATSNEPSDPNDKDDIEIKGKGLEPREVYLRAIELHHHDHDRDHDKRHHEPEEPKIYTITANASDLAGNPTTSIATCTVENPRKR